MAFSKPAMPSSPKEPTPVRIAAPDDPDLVEARKKAMQKEMQDRQGRQSTVLAGAAGPTFSRTTLG